MLSKLKKKKKTSYFTLHKNFGEEISKWNPRSKIFFFHKNLILIYWLQYAAETTSFYITVCIFFSS